MKENMVDLKFVTQKSMALASQKEIMLPSSYRVLFSLIAKKYNIDIGAEAIHSNEEINDKVYQHVLSMDSNTNRAIKAIEQKDDAELKKVLEQVRKLKSEIETLREVAYEDGLTKALNRKWFEENYLDTPTEQFKKDGVIAIIDMNDFKQINDTMGHAVGDKVLIHIAAVFKKYDTHVIRYGGDEFILIFDNNTPAEVKEIVNVIREIHLKKTYRVLNNDVKIRFAYGISEFKTGDSFSEVIANADSLMYTDKQKVKERLVS